MRLWSSRFSKDITAETLDYTQTVDIDARMIKADLWGTLAHVLMLCRQRIVAPEEGRPAVRALLDLIARDTEGGIVLDKDKEDVHLNLESMVIALTGLDVGGRIHTARSRNDQVVTDARLYVREQLIAVSSEALLLTQDLLDIASRHRELVIVGHTHSQAAQPISYGFWLSGHASVLVRDVRRLLNAYDTVNENPLGACAIAGTSFPINRSITTALLGFDRTLVHALDATSSRDFLTETSAALAILMTQLSRLAEELVLWSSSEFGLLEIGDAFTTGSSIMPQKKNPVVAELVRARAGIAIGSLVEILTVIKGVSMGYSCDLQQDKPPVWRLFDNALATLSIVRAQMATIRIVTERTEDQCWASFSTATELANHLVRRHDLPFRRAYHVTGTLVKQLAAAHQTLRNTNVVMQHLREHGIDADPTEIKEAVSPLSVLARQTSEGGTGSDAVAATIAGLRATVLDAQTAIRLRKSRVDAALRLTMQAAETFAAGGNIETSIDDAVALLSAPEN